MGAYQHPSESRTFYAPDREPATGLPFPLWHISGLDNYYLPRPALVRKNPNLQFSATTGSGPGSSFLGSDMRAAYYGNGSLTGAGQSIGLLEFLGYDIADLNTYYTNVGQTRTATVTGISTDGTSLTCVYSQGCDDTEQTLDMTQALGMAPGISTLYVYVGSTDTAILGAMSTTTLAPLSSQLSSSWFFPSVDPLTDDPYFEKMASQGQNFFQASGDCGAYPNASLACNNAGYYYPAEDAHVTAVGGTDLTTNGAGGSWASETAWVSSGGGISPDEIPIPSYQQLAGVINSSNGGSTTYRNVPDVAANANFSFYVCADQTTCRENVYGGTSFAAPMWAGYLALANPQQVDDGNNSLGFINLSIYPIGVGSGYSAAFHDITSGKKDCCGQTTWYNAVTGYDLVTGWGSPNGSGLINALTNTTGSYTITLMVTVSGSSEYPSAELCVNDVCASNSGESGSNQSTFGAGANLSWRVSGPAGACPLPGTGGQHGEWVYEGVTGYFNSSATSGEFTMPAENILLTTGWACEAN